MRDDSPSVAEIRHALRERRGSARMDARAMPGAYYTSPEWLEIERETLFRTQWICIGHSGEIPKPGDFFTTELVDEPLLAIRQSDGTIAVLSNVCRHRGNQIARGQGHSARLVCPYHGWSYAHDGQLLAAPLIPESQHFQKRDCRLPRFQSEIWQGYVFVNLWGDAPPLLPTLAAIEATIHNYHPEQQHFLFSAEEVWQTNWKLLVENFMEGYHLSTTHPSTLHPITPTKLCRKLPDGPAFTGYRAHFAPDCPERGPYHADLTEEERRSDVFYCIYPSFVVGFCPHFTLYMCVRPLTVDTVAIRWGITGNARDPDSPVVKDYIQLTRDFSAEDRRELEALQRALHSRQYTPGPLAPDDFEGTIWDLIQYVADRCATPPPSASESPTGRTLAP